MKVAKMSVSATGGMRSSRAVIALIVELGTRRICETNKNEANGVPESLPKMIAWNDEWIGSRALTRNVLRKKCRCNRSKQQIGYA